MQFEWDEEKAQRNLEKHEVDFQDATQVFLDFFRLDDLDDTTDEERYRSIGLVNGELLFVVYTWREDVIRIISARKANSHEYRTYYSHGP